MRFIGARRRPKHAVAVFGAGIVAALLFAAPAYAGALSGAVLTAPEYGLLQPVFFHRRRVEQLYCVDRVYWWFYRPYKTANKHYPRCMPYFHYLGENEYGGPPPRSSSALK